MNNHLSQQLVVFCEVNLGFLDRIGKFYLPSKTTSLAVACTVPYAFFAEQVYKP